MNYVMAGLRSIVRLVALIREARTLEQSILTARDLIADELRHNAQIVAGAEVSANPALWERARDRIQLERWHEYAGQLSIFRKRHPDLWEDVRLANASLKLSLGMLRPEVSSATLDALATRLEEVNL